MKSREYLIKLGLVKAGSRGRISATAKEALSKALTDGMTFSDISSEESIAVPKAQAKKKLMATTATALVKTRDEKVFYGIDRGTRNGQQDLVIAFDTCFGCGKAAQYCTHSIPVLPKWLDSKTYLEHP